MKPRHEQLLQLWNEVLKILYSVKPSERLAIMQAITKSFKEMEKRDAQSARNTR